MQFTVTGFNHGEAIPEEFAFGAQDEATHVRLSANRNPGLAWSNVPEETKSLVLICVDKDVPTKPDDVNKEDRTVPADLQRADFYHWAMVDIPPTVTGIDAGACSDGVTARGKDNPSGPAGSRQGINDYTNWFAGDKDMAGSYYGYDGPCPPWNDSIVHHYHFVLFATDFDRCPVDDAFTGADVETAIAEHILSKVCIIGTYSLNPEVPA